MTKPSNESYMFDNSFYFYLLNHVQMSEEKVKLKFFVRFWGRYDVT